MRSDPIIGIVGNRGAYGRWLATFFRERMGLSVIGRDVADRDAPTVRDLVTRADVLVFAAPIRSTPALIAEYAQAAAGAEQGQLWLDVTSIKSVPVAAMLASRAEVVGLHPMCAPPRGPTLAGHAMAVCEGRLHAWRDWFEAFVAATQANCVRVTPDQHDRAMALVQGMVHAGHMAQGVVWREYAQAGISPALLAPLASVGYQLDLAVTQRMLAANPAIYEDIQFGNPHIAPMLDALLAALDGLRECVRKGDDAARATLRADYLLASAAVFGDSALAAGSQTFEQVGYLLADLAAPRFLEVRMPADRPGSLRALLSLFVSEGINLHSIHSSRISSGELRFRFGLDAGVDADSLARALRSMQDADIAQPVAGARGTLLDASRGASPQE